MTEAPEFDGSMKQLIARSIPDDSVLQSQLIEEYAVFSAKEKILEAQEKLAWLVSIGIGIGTIAATRELMATHHTVASYIATMVGGSSTFYAIGWARNIRARASEARNGITAMQNGLYNRRLNTPSGVSNIHSSS